MDYKEWYENHRVLEKDLEEQKSVHFLKEPLISIIVPIYNTPITFLKTND